MAQLSLDLDVEFDGNLARYTNPHPVAVYCMPENTAHRPVLLEPGESTRWVLPRIYICRENNSDNNI